MRNSEKIYNSFRNIIRTSSDMCFFNYPQYEIAGMVDTLSGLTQESSNIILIEGPTDIPLDITFVNNLEYLDTDVLFNLNVLPLDKISREFTTTGMYVSTPMGYTGTTHETSLNTNQLLGEGEYVLKLSYQYPVCTQIANALGKKHVASTYNSTLPYAHYDSNNDKYMVVLNKAEEPRLDVGVSVGGGGTTESPTATADRLRINSLVVEDGVASYIIDVTTEGDILITLNGLMLSQDGDYTFSNGQLVFAEPLRKTDIVNYIFIGKDNTSGLKSEILSVDNPIESGPTGQQSNNYIYKNTDTNKYELYTEYRIQNPDSIIVILKGVVLANKIDYYVSSSDSKRIILQGDVYEGDWFNIIYDSGENIDRAITTGYSDVTWYVTNPIREVNGEFVVEVSKTKGFDVIEQTHTLPYEINKLTYTKRVDLPYEYGTVLFYRVRNIKKYVTLNEVEIKTENVSDSIRVEIKTNISNNY